MFVNFNILNQLGSPAINSNTFANRPQAGQTGRLFVSIDTFEIYRDNGTTWDLIGGPGSSTVTGTGAATQVAFWTAAQTIGGSNNLWWDSANSRLGIKTSTPSAPLEVVQTDGIGVFSNFTTVSGSGSGTTAIYALNTTASSGYSAVIEEKTPNTTGGQYPILIKHSLSSGTAAVGNGTGLHFQLQDDAGAFKTTQLTIETIDAAAATYATRYRFNVQNNGLSTPAAYLNATGLGLGTATPGTKLDIHGTGVLAQLNSTGTTNNGYLAFQRAGTTTIRIGDTYNSGTNYFGIYSNSLSADIAQFFEGTGKTVFQATQTYSSGLARGNYFDFNMSVPNGTTFSSPNAITALGATLDLTLSGSATIPSGARTGLDAYNTVAFTGVGTLTMSQGTQIRALSNLTTGWSFSGIAAGTITHVAGLRVLFPDSGSAGLNITNNYGLLINDQTANTGSITYTNRWGIYQEGTSDTNYFAATTLVGTTVNSGYKFEVSGSANATTLYENGVRVTTTGNISGTTNYIPKFTSANVIGNSQIFDNGTNVGIGTTNGDIFGRFYTRSLGITSNGTTSLQVNGTNYGSIDLGAGGTRTVGITGSATELQIATVTAIPILLTTNGSERARIFSNGNFVIGTTTDAGQKFQVVNASAGQTVSTFTGLYTSTSSVKIASFERNGGAVAAGIIYDDSNTSIQFGTTTNHNLILLSNNNVRATVTAGGNFLIGTTTDSGEKLQVNGRTKSTAFYSITGTKSIASGATATIYSIPAASSADGLYFVQVEITSGSAIYMASGVVTALAANGEAFFTSWYDGANVTLQVTGLNIEIVNGGFSTFTWNYSILFQSNT